MTEGTCCSINKDDPSGQSGKCDTNIDRLVTRIAGASILVTVVLGYLWSPWFYLLMAFIGANLLQSSYTGFCPLAKILKKLGVKSGAMFS